MMYDEYLYPIALTMMSGVGPVTAKSLIAHYGSAEAIFRLKSNEDFAELPKSLSALRDNSQKAEALERAKQEIEFAEKEGLRILYYQNQNYPFRLKECEDAPIILYQKGSTNLNSPKLVAIVGTRNITPYGKEMTERLVAEIAAANPGVIIVSGLAYGVDGNAHKFSLKENLTTVGVVAHGLDELYPKRHIELARNMVESGGSIVSEYTTETFADPSQFVQRNRIIAGLCDTTIVIESAERGGALLTAYAANAYDRDVFALPGRVGDTFSQGCNNLIKQNLAQIITCGDDLSQAMGWTNAPNRRNEPELFVELTAEEQNVVEILRSSPMGLNELSREVGMPVQKLISMLVLLEFKGMVKQQPGNIYNAFHK